jgi:hypothetical protein
MQKLLASTLIIATAAIGLTVLAAPANAREIRDHRMCEPVDPNCRDHRGPVIVVQPPQVPLPPPIVVVDPIPRPMPPVEPPHRPHHPHFPPQDQNWEDYADVSCGEARSIVRHSGFRHVKVVDCNGRFYRFNAVSRRDGRVTVLVNHDGDIVRVNYWTALR